MGTYFNPANELPEVARPISGRTFDELNASLRPGERLFALCDRGVFKIAVEIYGQAEYDDFNGQYRAGYLLSQNFYAMPEEVYQERC